MKKRIYPVTINLNHDEIVGILKASDKSKNRPCGMNYGSIIEKLTKRARKDWMDKLLPTLAQEEQLGIEMSSVYDNIRKIVLEPRKEILHEEYHKISEMQNEVSRKCEKLDEKFIQDYLDKNGITKFVARGRNIITLDQAKDLADWEKIHLGCTDHGCRNTAKPDGCQPKTVCLVTDYHDCIYFSGNQNRSFLKMFYPDLKGQAIKKINRRNSHGTKS
jgi:hypothetical protein